MNNVRQFLIPGAIFGSLALASFGYSVMASVPASDLPAGEVQLFTLSDSEQDMVDPEIDSEENPGDQSSCKISQSFPHEIRKWCNQIMRHSAKNNLDPNLVAALIWQESGGNPSAYSRSGAVGLMQVMPRDGIAASFQCINGPCFTNRPTIRELERPNFNIKYGTGMLAGLLNKYGNLREALKYYGPMDVGYSYADKVLQIFKANGG
ncbi:MAG: transglycosylase SLT domain-containing protein [Chloroflexota bacterium]|nr:MAG: transglycosylase SLT domain-containing protein [Chloroflexota bacterium]